MQAVESRPPSTCTDQLPAALQAGAFKIGDTAGTLDNIIACKLHRPGSVGFVSKSGGMSNEMYNVLARATDGLFEGEHLREGGGLVKIADVQIRMGSACIIVVLD